MTNRKKGEKECVRERDRETVRVSEIRSTVAVGKAIN